MCEPTMIEGGMVGKVRAPGTVALLELRRAALGPISGHTHKSCTNCLPYATRWRRQLLERTGLAA